MHTIYMTYHWFSTCSKVHGDFSMAISCPLMETTSASFGTNKWKEQLAGKLEMLIWYGEVAASMVTSRLPTTAFPASKPTGTVGLHWSSL